MEKKTHVDYDGEEDILSVAKAGPAGNSARIGDIILDFDNNLRIVGIEVMNAMDFFEAFELSKEDLKSVRDARLAVHYSKDWAIIKITLFLATRDAPIVKDVAIPSLGAECGLAGMEA